MDTAGHALFWRATLTFQRRVSTLTSPENASTGRSGVAASPIEIICSRTAHAHVTIVTTSTGHRQQQLNRLRGHHPFCQVRGDYVVCCISQYQYVFIFIYIVVLLRPWEHVALLWWNTNSLVEYLMIIVTHRRPMSQTLHGQLSADFPP